MTDDGDRIRLRTKISKGYQVAVPSELRRRYQVSVGDELLWEISDKAKHISIELHKKPGLNCITALGRSGGKRGSSSVELKKRIQKGAP